MHIVRFRAEACLSIDIYFKCIKPSLILLAIPESTRKNVAKNGSFVIPDRFLKQRVLDLPHHRLIIRLAFGRILL